MIILTISFNNLPMSIQSADTVVFDLDKAFQRRDEFVKRNPNATIDLFEFSKSNSAQISNLEGLTQFILARKYEASAYVYIYEELFPEVVSRWIVSLQHCTDDEAIEILSQLARIITIFPMSTNLIDNCMSEFADNFTKLLDSPAINMEKKSEILLAYYRILYENQQIFNKYIKMEILYKILATQESSMEMKFLAVRVLCTLLNTNEKHILETTDLYIGNCNNIPGYYEGLSNVNYKFMELNEAHRFSEFFSLPKIGDESNPTSSNIITFGTDCFTDHIVSICGILTPRIVTTKDTRDYDFDYVPTKQTVAVLKKLAKLIQKNEPMMLVGKAGTGKTFLINELSKYMKTHDSVVKIHLGEQTDAKLLIGTYTSGEKPGTFTWKSGVLATAVKEGRWVLIEDIDKAPTEVLSVILSLLEKRELTIPSRGETLKAAKGFQLIATVQTSERNSTKDSEPVINMIGKSAWNIVSLEEPSDKDLEEILSKKFSLLTRLIPQLIETYHNIHSIYQDPKFISLNKGSHSRGISIRDLTKLCHRLTSIFTANNIKDSDHLIETSVFDDIFAETADCFTAAVGEYRALEPLYHGIGRTLEIPESRILVYLNSRVPSFENQDNFIKIGRSKLEKNSLNMQKKSVNSTNFATTNHSLRLMEQIAMSIQMNEPLLLVGETGTGKTTVVQQVSKLLHKTLNVINVSQQTESGDLLGGYKPVNSKSIAIPIQEEFEILFASTFSMKKNERFYKMLHKFFNRGNWKNVVKLWNEAFKMASTILQSHKDEENRDSQKKRRKLNSNEKSQLFKKWQLFKDDVEKFEVQSSSLENSFVFNFVEGALVKAIKNGEWLLLDEINLASADTLESISDLLADPESRSILLADKGDMLPIKAHPDFRLFGCMNPATDVGKKELPSGIRSRFTEIYVHSPDRDISDLLAIIDKYIGKYSVSDEWVGNDIAELYLETKKLSENNVIVDGSNQRPHFSIRTLTRTLLYVCDIVHVYGLRRALYDGFCMSFLTLLDQKSEDILRPLISKYTIGRLKNIKSVLSQIPQSPGEDYIQFKHYWMKKGPGELKPQAHYIITPFVEKNMMNLVRATLGSRFPVLIQGPTSAGKTSMIKYLADITGHTFVRINNHEHTDLQEYLGTYVTDDTGKLSFKEGILVEALRKGYWIVLDELNLAPTDVLEALNRLLDDNRELFIPETQEVVHPHPDFMLFATQNPPGLYGGRKFLSRAFRNRFLELHFDDIPQDELEIILRERCQIAPTYAKKIVEVYRQLAIERSANRLFEQKNSFATLRDLFRWAMRDAVGYEELAANGYMLLAERCRSNTEKLLVKKVLERVMKVKLNMNKYYMNLEDTDILKDNSIVWTNALRKLVVLVSSAMKNKEPILLVGETGCGKTTVFQLLSKYLRNNLIILNAHQNTETGDILGAQRPVRNRSGLQEEFKNLVLPILNINNDEPNSYTVDDLIRSYNKLDKSEVDHQLQTKIENSIKNMNILFEWKDGPLVQAMKSGNFFLLDEISLADDSVLERLNSVLEPERSLLLAEKGSSDALVTASERFQFFATMNPGGDYGKKELSPALRNRFTEIWVPSMDNLADITMIVEDRLQIKKQEFANIICKFTEWFGKKFGGGDASSGVVSLRDILSWVEFINESYDTINNHYAVLVHGASMVFIDALGTNNTAHFAEDERLLKKLKFECIEYLSNITNEDLTSYIGQKVEVTVRDNKVCAGLFSIPIKDAAKNSVTFNFSAPTTTVNTMKVIRAMQVHKPILLEGSPGVGKTSLITALANATGNNLTRINLSEQTDLVDLFGSDAPGENSGEFIWKDAPFLRAMQLGEWVLLDEMNLASQSVLEGLNACLDHRGMAYIPELDRSFSCHPNFMVFAAQNPQYQGGGRKGLPKSFVNRFSVVYVDMLDYHDLLKIANHLYPEIKEDIVEKMIRFISLMEDELVHKKSFGAFGSPWEFNLRDTLRWLKLLRSSEISDDPLNYVDTIVTQRFRADADKTYVNQLIKSIFGKIPTRDKFYCVLPETLQVNSEIIERCSSYHHPSLKKIVPLQCNFDAYESLIRCIKYNWPAIIVGPSKSGKTELINFIADVVGQKVDVFSMNSDVDSMDILGGYEQVDLNRKLSQIRTDILSILADFIQQEITKEIQDFQQLMKMIRLYESINERTVLNEISFQQEVLSVVHLLDHNEKYNNLLLQASKITNLIGKDMPVKFEWFDGMLIQAIEKGHWLILDNANLCSPSVLDRLNSLLETESTLLINECSNEDGSTRVLKPHPNFRLFLTVDPHYGELSRAMRNRGVEIYLEALPDRTTTFDKNLIYESMDGSMPLQKFMPVHLSQLNSFAEIQYLLSNSSNISSNILASRITPFCRKTLASWYENLAVTRNTTNLLQSNHLVQFIKLIETNSLIIEDSQQSSLINPLINVYLLPQIRKSYIKTSDEEVMFLFVAHRLLNKLITELNHISNASTSLKMEDMNYLELSAAIYNGRYLKNRPNVPIFEILMQIQNYLISSFGGNGYEKQQNFYKCHVELLLVLLSLIETCGKKDEARLRVYKTEVQKWISNATVEGFAIDSILLAMDNFEDSLKLKRGKGMSALWIKFRDSYPRTSVGWSLWIVAEELSFKFDKIAKLQFSNNLEIISNLKQTFFIVFDEICRDNLDIAEDLISKLKTGIDELEVISKSFLVQKRNYFENEFDDIIVYTAALQANKPSTFFNILALSSFSTLNGYKLTRESTSYPKFLSLLWSFDDNNLISKSGTLLTGKFAETTLSKANNLHEIIGSQVDETIHDVKALLSALLSTSYQITSHSLEQTFKTLVDWIVAIIEAFTGSNVIYRSYNELLSELRGLEAPVLEPLQNPYFLGQMEAFIESKCSFALASCWIYFGITLIELFCPDTAFDPAIENYVQYDLFRSHRDFLQAEKSGWAKFRMVTSGVTPIYNELLAQSIEEPSAPEKPLVYRTNEAVDDLFDEWNAFLLSSLSQDHINDLVQAGKLKHSISSRLDSLQVNSSKFVERVKSGFKMFSDLNDIFAGYIFAIKFGFDIMKQKLLNDNLHQGTTRLWAVNPLLTVSEYSVKQHFKNMFVMLQRASANNYDADRTLLHFVRLFRYFKQSDELLDIFHESLHTLYARWSMRKMQSEKKQEEQAKTFKYTDESDDFEREFREMFPDYDDELNLSEDIKSQDEETVDLYHQLTIEYMNLFSSDEQLSLNDVITEGTKISSLDNSLSAQLTSGIVTPETLLSVANILAQKINGFDKTENKSFSIFKDFSIPESKKAARSILTLLGKVNELLNQWPENATLQDLFRTCHEFLSFTLDTTIARQLQKLEQIYTILTEWEKYASSTVSLNDYITEIVNTLVSWRRMELRSWSELLLNEDKQAQRSISKWWFYLYETIILPTESNMDGENEKQYKLLQALNVFFSESTIGEYDHRINLVISFKEHLLNSFPNKEQTINALTNIILYYKQFQEKVQDVIKTTRKTLDKDMKDIILLASWKDVNIDALKQSSKKSHNNLYKIVRKYRNVISGKVTDLITGGLQFSKPKSLGPRNLNNLNLETLCVDLSSVTDVDEPLKLHKNFRNIDTIVHNMKHFTNIVKQWDAPDFTQLSEEYLSEADRLRKETPSQYKKEIKKHLAALKVQKRKLLSDGIKELRRIGLKSSYRIDIQKVQSSSTLILANAPALVQLSDSTRDEWFYKLIDLLPRLRSAISEPNEEVPITSLEKGMAITENLVFSLIVTRTPILELQENSKVIEQKLLYIRKFMNSNFALKFNTQHKCIKNMSSDVSAILNLVNYSLETLSSVSQYNNKDNDNINSCYQFLKTSKEKFMSLENMISNALNYDISFSDVRNEFSSLILSSRTEVQKISTPNNSMFIQPVHDYLLNVGSIELNDELTRNDESHFEAITSLASKLSDAVLVRFQKVMSNNFDNLSESDDKWLQLLSKKLLSSLKDMNSKNISKLVSELYEMIISCDYSKGESIKLRKILKFVLPFICGYVGLSENLLEKTWSFYYQLSSGTYVFGTILYNLAKDGFCSPPPPSEETNDENLHEGTGLGDGEGAENKSNDIDQDEDLTEDAQTSNQDQKDKDDREDDDEDNAVDMEGDMAGELEDISDQDNSDDSDNESDEEELDEEINDIDDDDANAVDDKMWDEKVDDNLKEKETDNQIENQNNESEDVQAAENEQQENGDEGSNKEPDSKEENNEDQQNDSENQNGDEQEQDLDNEESGEEDVGQQEDEVVNDEKEEQMFDAPEIETMELPEDMQLDSEEESKSDNEEEEDDMKDSGFESNAEEMEVEEDILDEKQNKDDMEVDNLEEENIEEENNLSDANEENDNQEGENNDEDNNDVDMQDEEQTLQEEPQTENGETGTNIDDEGAEGIENYLDNNDETSEANAEQNAGAKGAGADTKDDEDQENIGDSGMTNLEHQEQEKDSENHNDSSREKANEVLKELGDSLKEYHNRRQEINNPSNDENKENENKANQRPDEFEHLDGANTETDTQALGGANQEEANKIDDDLAINDDLDEEEKIDSDIDTDDAANLESHNEIKEELEEDLNTDIQKDTDSKSQGAFASTMKDLSIEDKEIYENDGLFKREDYENELDQLMDEIDKETNLKAEIDKPQRDLTESRELWRKSEIETVELSARLGEQLRLILEPTLATKLRGDYKTGKRLNMKRIIPYIASQYRKDKIWLRRTKPSKRQYQIMLALDNSKSMSESKSAQLAFNSLCLVSKTLSQLESGGLSIVRFGEYTKEVHSFDQNFSNDSGSKVFQWFNFQEDKTDVKRLVGESIKIFERARAYSDNDQWQLEIVISDGLCEDHDTVERLVRRARDKKIMLVFVIIDNLGQSNESIMDMSQVKYVPDSSGNLQLKITKYLDTFPFEFYVVVHDIVELPEMLALILRQYFSDLASQ